MSEGGSAGKRAEELRAEAAAARARAESLDREAGAWEAGAEGERRVGAQLNALPDAWHVLHDRLLRPGRSATNLDHVAVGPAGIFLIDSKNWAGRLTLYQGTLWQHNGGHQSRRSDLEQVARAAAQMESVLGVPVTPLIALAGRAGIDLDPCRVHGVEVVPARRLQSWFSTQPASVNALQIDALVRSVSVAFPAASPACTPRPIAGRPVRGSGRSPRRRPASPRRTALRRRQLGGFWKLLIALALLSMAPSVLPRVAGSVAERIEHSVRPAVQTTAAPAACSVVEKEVAALLGGSVNADPYRVAGQCRWSVIGQPHEVVTDVTIDLATRIGGDAIVSAQAGSAVAIAPKQTSIRGWGNSKLVAPQSISIRLRYAYPRNATRLQREKADSIALRHVVVLSEKLAGALAARRAG